MVINHLHRFVWFHIPKTGGSSLRLLLQSLEGNEPGTRPGRAPYADHLSPASLHGGRPDLREYHWWAVKRDPWRRMESAYRHKMHRRKDPPGFSEFVLSISPGSMRMDPVLMPQSHWLTHGVTAYPWSAVSQIGFLPRVNVSAPCECVWTTEAKAHFSELYAVDLEDG